MRRHLVLLVVLSALAPAAVGRAADSWIFRPTRYTHDPVTQQRVSQYSRKQPAYVRVDPTYRQSGYQHNRSTLRGIGGSVDRRHTVETWGAGESIRPYGEWEYPFRAGATPYGPWGNAGGPWTLPFESWDNPYGLGNLPHPPWPHAGYPIGVPYGGSRPGGYPVPYGGSQSGGYPASHRGSHSGGYPAPHGPSSPPAPSPHSGGHP